MITRRAFAKVNLMLSVGEALPAEHAKGGYHPIASWLSAIGLHDDLTIEPLGVGQASKYDIRWAEDAPRAGLVDWPLDKDLAVRAHRAMEARVGRALPVAMKLVKRIPVGAGLGGGSSDAAACLMAMREAFELAMPDEVLREIAMTLGSDVAFFVDEEGREEDDEEVSGGRPPRPALVSGLGEVIERVEPIEKPILLVVPGFGCSTPAVYKAFDDALAAELKEYRMDRAVAGATGRERSTGPREEMVRGRVAKMIERGSVAPDLLFNDLSKAAFAVEPRLGQLVTALSNATRSPAHVTGSGSCVFLAPPAAKMEWYLPRVQKACAALGATGAFGGEPAVVVTGLVG
jgi:4-diphosphocytidyl-2-C-methyl-D-erythritol kinase